MTDINYSYAEWSENHEIYAFYHQRYGHGFWYDTREKTYSQAIEECKRIIREKVKLDHPHLSVDKVLQTPEMPIYKEIIKSIPQEDKPTLTEEEAICEAIRDCKEMAWLKLWRKKSQKYDSTKQAYIKKEQELLIIK